MSAESVQAKQLGKTEDRKVHIHNKYAELPVTEYEHDNDSCETSNGEITTMTMSA